MSTSDSHREQPSTYFVQDRSNQDELTRIQVHDQLATIAQGGVLAEQPHPENFQQVLDVGCGTGGWLIETAKTYPGISRLEGVDISQKIIDFARAQAVVQQVSERVSFHVMDALRMLEFPNDSFDLVNQRSGAGYLRKWDWPKLLQEYLRVTRPGGLIRITEGDWAVESNSPALTRLFHLLLAAFYQAGHSFAATSDGVTSELGSLLHQFGLQHVQTQRHPRENRAGTPDGQLFIEDMKLVFRTTVPFLRKWIALPDDYEDLYQQMLRETQRPDFVARGSMLTAWGTKPE
jgi:ubiquinone/menaquinone biosynthesis C-methylase UbiE